MKKCFIALADGQIFSGVRFGADGEALGELVFTTGMGGYLETLTDPSYSGQIVLQTFPEIGNYGVIPEDFESAGSHVRGYVVRNLCEFPSNFRSEGALDAFLRQQGVPGVCGVDTREITRTIRERGVMNAAIVDDPAHVNWEALKSYAVTHALDGVCALEEEEFPARGAEKFRVVLLNYGAKKNIVRELQSRGVTVHSLPYTAAAREVLSKNPDGLMLSNGPGDPAENVECVSVLRELFGQLPIFGICLGHQMLALAAGAQTGKLKYGHRGVNQPVKRLSDGRVFISSQNHGYHVRKETLPDGAVLSWVNANDLTCEGVDYPKKRAFSVQFHPEACSGPRDTGFLFDRFVEMMKGR